MGLVTRPIIPAPCNVDGFNTLTHREKLATCSTDPACCPCSTRTLKALLRTMNWQFVSPAKISGHPTEKWLFALAIWNSCEIIRATESSTCVTTSQAVRVMALAPAFRPAQGIPLAPRTSKLLRRNFLPRPAESSQRSRRRNRLLRMLEFMERWICLELREQRSAYVNKQNCGTSSSSICSDFHATTLRRLQRP